MCGSVAWVIRQVVFACGGVVIATLLPGSTDARLRCKPARSTRTSSVAVSGSALKVTWYGPLSGQSPVNDPSWGRVSALSARPL